MSPSSSRGNGHPRYAGVDHLRAKGAALQKCTGTRLVKWTVLYSRQARKDARKLAAAGLKPNAEALLEILAANPFQTPPPYEKLVGDLAGTYARRINIHNRLVYEVFPKKCIVRV